MTIFDRYLLSRYWHVFGIGLFATFGLFVVFDGFTNVDAFQSRAGEAGAWGMLQRMARFYACQSVVIFDLVGPILTVIATMIVFTLLQKNREIYPILSAGVPTHRLVVPMLIGAAVVNGLLILNQEIVLPALADELLKPMGASHEESQKVQARRDFATHIEISGKDLILSQRRLRHAEFLLPAPEIVSEITTLKAEFAVFHPRTDQRAAGWQLSHVTPHATDLRLTDAGQKVVFTLPASEDLFVATEIGCDQLLGTAAAFRYQSTVELIQRLRNPAFSAMAVRLQALNLHERLTRPLGNLLAVCLAVPLVLRREGFSLITNLAVCFGIMLCVLVFGQAGLYLGRLNWVRQDFAIWLPIIVTGGLTAWYADRVQT